MALGGIKPSCTFRRSHRFGSRRLALDKRAVRVCKILCSRQIASEKTMSIKSSPFGPTILTGDDARKFVAQVTHGRPNPAAKESVRRGVELAREFQKTGKLTVYSESR